MRWISLFDRRRRVDGLLWVLRPMSSSRNRSSQPRAPMAAHLVCLSKGTDVLVMKEVFLHTLHLRRGIECLMLTAEYGTFRLISVRFLTTF